MTRSPIAPRLIEPTLLFDFSISLRVVSRHPSNKARKVSNAKTSPKNSPKTPKTSPFDWELGPSHLLPHFAALAGYATSATVWAGWALDGMYFKMNIAGKSSPPRFYGNSGGVSDGLRVWIDTRSSPAIHRATRFCHCFHFFPAQSDSSQPAVPAIGTLDSIPRCRESPSPIESTMLNVASQTHGDGYSLWAHVPSECLTGFAPDQFDVVSLFTDVVDFELGTQSISLGPELRYVEDPSLWIRANLINDPLPD